jgi:hypothetical protein
MPTVCRVFIQQQLSGQSEEISFRALYGRKCRTPLYWDQIGERQVFGPDIVEEAE